MESRRFGLTLRMVLATVLTPLMVVVLLVAVVAAVPGRQLVWLLAAICAGVVSTAVAYRKQKPPPGRVLTQADDPELFAVLSRLCGLADVVRPEVVLSDQRQPNSWVVHMPGREPRLYVTQGLRELLSIDELAAVLAHELAHIANRDALVMTVVGTPGTVMRNARGGWAFPLWVIGLLSAVGTNILSRYRELAADAASAQITGRPTALAIALMKVSDSLERVPRADLRSAAALNAFNLVAVPDAGRWWHHGHGHVLSRILATHPPLQARLEALHDLERAQQSGSRRLGLGS